MSPSHPRGRHKARVFREALDLQHSDAAWLRNVLLEAAHSNEASPIVVDHWGTHWRLDATIRRQGTECCGKNHIDRADRRERAEVRHLLGAVMKAKKGAKSERPSVLDVVTLLTDLPRSDLPAGRSAPSSSYLTTRLCSWSSATTKVVLTRSRTVRRRTCSSCTTSLRRPDHRTAAQKGTLARFIACCDVRWRTAADEDGSIASPWRYDLAADQTIRPHNLRRTAISRYALCTPVLGQFRTLRLSSCEKCLSRPI